MLPHEEKTARRIRRHIYVAADCLCRASDGTNCVPGTMAEDTYVESQLNKAKEAVEMALQRITDYKAWILEQEGEGLTKRTPKGTPA
jgi:hypothetical protein